MAKNIINRDELKKNFKNPPNEYGELPCYWWESGKLNKDIVRDQITDLRNKGMSGTVMFNLYFPGDKFSSKPEYFSEGWWEVVKFLVEEENKLGMEFWFSDWTGRRYWEKAMLLEAESNKSLAGYRLLMHNAESSGQNKLLEIIIPLQEKIIDAAAYKKIGDGIDFGSRVDLAEKVAGNIIKWEAPDLSWVLTAIVSSPYGLDFLEGNAAKRWIELYWSQFEKRMPQYIGNTIKGYIQDELYVLNGNILYSELILDKNRIEKKFDLKPYLAGLFYDIGDLTDKVRCSYYDNMVGLLEENFYGLLSKWHEKRGLIYGTEATWGRMDMIAQTYHYGDFFRMMKYFHVTGNEDPRYTKYGDRRFIDDKLSSSIADLYSRNQVMVDCHWQAGWGITQEQNLAWANENYAYGMNCYNRHGVVYTLMGGWMEWVPPEDYFFQPYWEHSKAFSDYIKRLSYILRQGSHRADTAILYPITAVHAGWSKGDHFSNDADFSARNTFSIAKHIYKYNIDFDFIDNDSIEKAGLKDGKLVIGGNEFKILILPPMSTISIKTLKKIKEFYEDGGMVISYNKLPDSSAENGRNDPLVSSLIEIIFGIKSSDEYKIRYFHREENISNEEKIGYSIKRNKNIKGGKAFYIPGSENLIPEVINSETILDFEVKEGRDIFHADQNEPMPYASGSNEKVKLGIFHTHRKLDGTDIYFLFNSNEREMEIECTFRLIGKPEIWDPHTGEVKKFFKYEITGGRTRLRVKMEKLEGLVVIFNKYDESPQVVEDNLEIIDDILDKNPGLMIKGHTSKGGRKKVLIKYKDSEYVSEARIINPPESILIKNDWDFTLEPTMNNRRGDYRYPESKEFIGPEARRFKYMIENSEDGIKLNWQKPDFDYSSWNSHDYTYGPYFWNIGPFKDSGEPKELLADIENNRLSYNKSYKNSRNIFNWQHYDFSLDFGSPDKRVHNTDGNFSMGLEGVSENFIVFPENSCGENLIQYLYSYVISQKEEDFVIDFGGIAAFHRSLWLNGSRIFDINEKNENSDAKKQVYLKKGVNTIVLRIVQQKGAKIWTYLDLRSKGENLVEDPLIPRLKWFTGNRNFIYDITPDRENQIGWYRFEAPPGLEEIKFDMDVLNKTCFVDGEKVDVTNDKIKLGKPKQSMSKIALRVVHKPGSYAGAAFKSPVLFKCLNAKVPLGNWEDLALESYSGGAVYKNVFYLDKTHLKNKVIIDLGMVMITTELIINDKKAGIKLAQPYRFDITDFVKAGENKIIVKVYNSLANHYNVGYPTEYVYENQTISGLLGPVSISFMSPIELDAVISGGKEIKTIKSSVIPRRKDYF